MNFYFCNISATIGGAVNRSVYAEAAVKISQNSKENSSSMNSSEGRIGKHKN